MRDLMNNIHPVVAISPQVVADNTAAVGEWIDTLGYDSLTFLIGTGTLADADATFAVTLDEADEDDQSDVDAVADTDLIGTEALASFTFGDDDEARKVGYRGHKRYVRPTITPTGNGGDAPVCALAILGHPRSAPTANPPA